MKGINCALIIDDDRVTNYVSKRLLEKLRISDTIKIVVNGLEAIQYIKSYQNATGKCPEFILLDINMPVMNGFEFLKQFEQMEFSNQKFIHIIMLTTSSNQSDMEEVAKYNIKGFLNKPLTEEKLVSIFKY